jgi:hypothetical protein
MAQALLEVADCFLSQAAAMAKQLGLQLAEQPRPTQQQ